ncbi:MAG: hypothetical protein KDE22_06625 [Rhodobacterales bacterium]|nr:hypothetical protein [Rhodobacterales bacterium]
MRTLIGTSFLALAVLALASPAEAAGLPQLEPKNFSPQLVWLAITFAVMYWLMSKVALPRVAQVLEERQIKIDESLSKAETLKQEAEHVAAAYEASLTDARNQALDSVKTVRDEAAHEAASRQAALAEKLAADVKAAEANIAQARDTALAGVRDMAVEIAQAATERLVGDAPDGEAAGRAVDAVMREQR